MTDTFPLKWPLGRKRTESWQRKVAPFKTTPVRARDELMHELKLLGATNIIISSNVATYRRGGQDIMYADQSSAKLDPGVAVYYSWKGDQYALACDRWKTVMDNLQALNKTVDAIRGIERWGTGEMMRAAFAGFKELPAAAAADTPGRQWWEILNVSSNSPWWQVEAAYRELRKQAHPDAGGTNEQFIEVQQAFKAAQEYRKQ